MHGYIGKRGEVCSGPLCKRRLNLIGINRSCLPHQFCKKGRVVAGACANVDNSFAFLGSQRCNAEGVQGWLPIVERFVYAE